MAELSPALKELLSSLKNQRSSFKEPFVRIMEQHPHLIYHIIHGARHSLYRRGILKKRLKKQRVKRRSFIKRRR
jgi:hypothetical protein